MTLLGSQVVCIHASCVPGHIGTSSFCKGLRLARTNNASLELPSRTSPLTEMALFLFEALPVFRPSACAPAGFRHVNESNSRDTLHRNHEDKLFNAITRFELRTTRLRTSHTAVGQSGALFFPPACPCVHRDSPNPGG